MLTFRPIEMPKKQTTGSRTPLPSKKKKGKKLSRIMAASDYASNYSQKNLLILCEEYMVK